MKKSKIILATFIGVLIATVSVEVDMLDKDYVIPAESLPLAAKNYVQDNFPDGTIAYAKVKNDIYKTSYEVRLNNGFELEFDKSGMITDFDDFDDFGRLPGFDD